MRPSAAPFHIRGRGAAAFLVHPPLKGLFAASDQGGGLVKRYVLLNGSGPSLEPFFEQGARLDGIGEGELEDPGS